MGKLFSIFSKKTKELTCNEEVGILDIRNNYIYTRDGNVIAGLKIYSINTQLLTEREKQNLINELSAELYKQTEAAKGAEGGEAGEGTKKADDDVVDAEVVDEDKK